MCRIITFTVYIILQHIYTIKVSMYCSHPHQKDLVAKSEGPIPDTL